MAMNEIDPKNRFSVDSVRKFEDGLDYKSLPTDINDVARQVATQYRRDTMSPVMVSGVLRLTEFALLVISGIALYGLHVGFSTHLFWHYPTIIIGGAQCGQEERPPRHPRRALHPQDLDRRAAAVLQRPQGPAVGGRAASACTAGEGRQQALL